LHEFFPAVILLIGLLSEPLEIAQYLTTFGSAVDVLMHIWRKPNPQAILVTFVSVCDAVEYVVKHEVCGAVSIEE
jgi:hypothetical protein